MSGYLLANGTDLTSLFKPYGNTFTGNNTFNGLTTMNGGFKLPSSGVAPTRTEIGYTYILNCSPYTLVKDTVTVVATLPANTLVPGTYLVNIIYPLTSTSTYVNFIIELNRLSGGLTRNLPNTMTTKTQTIGSPIKNVSISHISSGNFSTIILVPNTTQIYYLNVYISFPAANSIIGSPTEYSGSLFFTRIA
jgi:hypothetical protein